MEKDGKEARRAALSLIAGRNYPRAALEEMVVDLGRHNVTTHTKAAEYRSKQTLGSTLQNIGAAIARRLKRPHDIGYNFPVVSTKSAPSEIFRHITWLSNPSTMPGSERWEEGERGPEHVRISKTGARMNKLYVNAETRKWKGAEKYRLSVWLTRRPPLKPADFGKKIFRIKKGTKLAIDNMLSVDTSEEGKTTWTLKAPTEGRLSIRAQNPNPMVYWRPSNKDSRNPDEANMFIGGTYPVRMRTRRCHTDDIDAEYTLEATSYTNTLEGNDVDPLLIAADVLSTIGKEVGAREHQLVAAQHIRELLLDEFVFVPKEHAVSLLDAAV